MEIRISWTQVAIIAVVGYVAYQNRDILNGAITVKKA